jgi:hypothetical protein
MSEYRFYSVYGERLASTIAIPELDEIPAGPARWKVEHVASLPPMRGAVELGAEAIYGDVYARLHAHAHGHRVVVDDTGAFDILDDRRRILVEAYDDAWPDFVRAHLTGRVLATALYLDGLLPLHGSSVATGAGAIGFLAPKGYGKSSLALALAKAGAWLRSDDALPIEPGSAVAWPGLHGLRVRDDSLGAVGVTEGRMRTREGKHVITALGQERVFARPMALAALYLLAPVEPDGDEADRLPLPPTLAAISIVAHVKVGAMLGPNAGSTMLARASRIAMRVPVFQLRTPRDLTLLERTAHTVLSWHGIPEP